MIDVMMLMVEDHRSTIRSGEVQVWRLIWEGNQMEVLKLHDGLHGHQS